MNKVTKSNSDYYTKELHWKQTHMILKADSKSSFELARSAIIHSRALLEQYILEHPEFSSTLEPLQVDLMAPEFVRRMMQAGVLAGVGPMAAVAGGLSEVATEAMLSKGGKFALAENGGDISIRGVKPVTIGIYAGESSVAKRLGFKIKADELPLGVCTSAQLGHSISLGAADAAIVFSNSAFVSDAAATAIANYIKRDDPEGSLQGSLEKADDIDGLFGCMVFVGELVGRTGRIPEMVEVIDSDV